jgi:hypothetical protein
MSTKSPLPKGLDDPQADLAIFGGPGECPEKDLMVAMILNTKLDLFCSNKRRSEMALTWFLCTGVKDLNGRPWLLSFQNICEQLDLDPDIVLQGLLKSRENP